MTTEKTNVQLTLTFRKDMTIREGNTCIFLWLHKIDRSGLRINYRFIPELGKKIKIHYHGYFDWDPTDSEAETLVHYMIYRWKTDYGYYYESHGPLMTWLQYINKQVQHHANLKIPNFQPISPETTKKHRLIPKEFHQTDQTAIDLEHGVTPIICESEAGGID